MRYPQRHVRAAVSGALAADLQNAFFFLKQLADGLDRDAPHLCKVGGCVMLLPHDVGLLQTIRRAFGRLFQVWRVGWVPVQKFDGNSEQIGGIRLFLGAVWHKRSIPNPLRLRYTWFPISKYPHKHW